MNNLRTRQSIALSFLAGYVDTVGFIALFGLFTAHVTGNFVLIGSELANPSHGVLIKLLAFPAFIFAVALTRMAVIWLERGGRAPMFYLLLLQLVFLLGFMLAGYLAEPVTNSRAPLALLAGMLGAAGMGVQNASSRLVLQHLTPTTVMTGNVTQVIIDLVDILRGAATDEIRQRCRKFFWPIVAFGAGAIGGAFAYKHLLFLALLLPLALLLWLSVKEYLSEKTGTAAPSTL
ncbi:YoaK family protein [Collimonas humicola]|uniref:YoaK family protein n=1 Tax=Collimonas humicola TaxID=2825886 RepID=UPI001B8BC27E|nr:YoaK family protein [Collimonas humicola]